MNNTQFEHLNIIHNKGTQAQKEQADSVQYGRSMIEMLGVLAILGVLSVGGIAGFSKIMAQHKITKTVEQISIISTKLSAVGAEVTSYGGLTNASAAKLNALPADMILEGSVFLSNPFGGDITIEAQTLVSGQNDQQAYSITYDGLTEEACVTLAGHSWGTSDDSTLIGVGVGASTAYKASILNNLYQNCEGVSADNFIAACATGNNVTIPMSIEDAVQGCSCSRNGCILVLKYF